MATPLPTPHVPTTATPDRAGADVSASPPSASIVKRVARLRHPGVLSDFSWSGQLRCFHRFNLIYGWNGCGKTTLSEVFRALEGRRVPRDTQVSLEFATRTIDEQDFPNSDVMVRVFNREYVRESVFPVGGGTLPVILVLGRENVLKQQEVVALKEKCVTLARDRESARTAHAAAQRRLDKFFVDRAGLIRDTLRTPGANRYNNYDKSDFGTRIAVVAKDGKALPLTSADYESTFAQSRALEKPPVAELAVLFPNLAGLHRRVTALRSASVSARIIESLKNDPAAAEWVRRGLDLHHARGVEDCLYCAQPIPPERRIALENHFSSAYRDFLAEVDACLTQIKDAMAGLERPSLPVPAQLHDALAPTLKDALDQVGRLLDEHRDALRALSIALEEKREQPFTALSSSLPPPSPDTSPLARVQALIKQHNQHCSDFEKRTLDARAALEGHFVASAVPDFAELQRALVDASGVGEKLGAELQEASARVAALEREIAEHRRPAEELNSDLRDYLGHGELELAISDTGYQLTRAGQPALGLSEGEETAIALLYFLKSLEDRRFDLEHGLVVLDDPVSSLDANSLYMAFGFIQHHVQCAGQLLILTHNFTFFRQVRRWFTSRENRGHSSLYMLETSCADTDRRSTLRPLDPLLASFESEYHYLFARVLREARAGSPASLEPRYVLPNVARRLLETFVAFRKPTVAGGFEMRVRSLNGPEARKIRVLRFLHANSHGEVMAEPEHDLSHLAESPAVLDDLLELIKAEDPQHYQEMATLCTRGAPTS